MVDLGAQVKSSPIRASERGGLFSGVCHSFDGLETKPALYAQTIISEILLHGNHIKLICIVYSGQSKDRNFFSCSQ
jgi:hypothetical protein